MTLSDVSQARAHTEETGLDLDHTHLESGTSLWRDAWYRLRRNRLAAWSFSLVSVLALVALLAPWIVPYPFDAIDFTRIGQAPSLAHWFGTDDLGRDLLTRTVHGLRISFAVGMIATCVSLCIGVLWGSIAGFVGGTLDALMMRVVDVMYSLPYMFFVIILMTIFGRNILILFLALGAVQWLTMARIVRGQVLSLRHKEFVEGAQSVGCTRRRIIVRHLIPNTLGPVIIYTTLTIPRIILEEAFLSFLGLGVQAPMASLGSLTSDGAQAMEIYPWLLIAPSLVLALLLLSLNFLGDGLRDALDPRMHKG
ncbi:MAG: ABC transporter permease subunit [Deltaproteobacteria bacterium]|nr:ABC transporter permease subunit [Deltaproteobacteria bacterium]